MIDIYSKKITAKKRYALEKDLDKLLLKYFGADVIGPKSSAVIIDKRDFCDLDYIPSRHLNKIESNKRARSIAMINLKMAVDALEDLQDLD